MTWKKVRCFECGTVYSAELNRLMYQHIGDSWEYCPVCSCDYLLGFSSNESEVTIR